MEREGELLEAGAQKKDLAGKMSTPGLLHLPVHFLPLHSLVHVNTEIYSQFWNNLNKDSSDLEYTSPLPADLWNTILPPTPMGVP